MRYSIEPKERRYVKFYVKVLCLFQEILVINIVNL